MLFDVFFFSFLFKKIVENLESERNYIEDHQENGSNDGKCYGIIIFI